MARKVKSFVMDSWAALAYLEDEPSSQKVADVIANALESGAPLRMSVISAAEVWNIVAQEISDLEAEKAMSALAHLGVEFVDVTWPLAHLAAGFRIKHKISLASSLAAALAKERRSELVTGDKEFKQVDGEIAVHWV